MRNQDQHTVKVLQDTISGLLSQLVSLRVEFEIYKEANPPKPVEQKPAE